MSKRTKNLMNKIEGIEQDVEIRNQLGYDNVEPYEVSNSVDWLKNAVKHYDGIFRDFKKTIRLDDKNPIEDALENFYSLKIEYKSEKRDLERCGFNMKKFEKELNYLEMRN